LKNDLLGPQILAFFSLLYHVFLFASMLGENAGLKATSSKGEGDAPVPLFTLNTGHGKIK